MFGKLDLHIARGGLRPALVYTVDGPDGEPVRVLSSGGVFQSATYLGKRRMEPVFEYYHAFGRVLEGVAAPSPRVLVVGGGGFAVPKLVRALRPAASIDVVEIDPKVIEAVSESGIGAPPCAARSTTSSRSTHSRAPSPWRLLPAMRPRERMRGFWPPAARWRETS